MNFMIKGEPIPGVFLSLVDDEGTIKVVASNYDESIVANVVYFKSSGELARYSDPALEDLGFEVDEVTGYIALYNT